MTPDERAAMLAAVERLEALGKVLAQAHEAMGRVLALADGELVAARQFLNSR